MARTNLRMKIYDIAFCSVFLSMPRHEHDNQVFQGNLSVYLSARLRAVSYSSLQSYCRLET